MLTDTVARESTERAETVEAVATSGRSVVTLEKGIYGVLVLVALVLRLVDLGGAPMNAHEAGQAIAAYTLATGAGLPSGIYNPLLLTFNFVTFVFGGASDTFARLLPALAGALLVAIPYWMRRWLDRPGAIASATLLAISPAFVLFSRLVDPAVIAAFAIAATLTMGLRVLVSHIPRRYILTAAYLAVALVAGRSSWVWALLTIGFALAVVYYPEDSVTREDILAAARALRDDRSTLITTIVVGVVVFLVLSTSVFFNPTGLQAVLDTAAGWWRAGGESVAAWHYLLDMAAYDTLTLILGIVGLVWLIFRRRNLFAVYLGLWFLVMLILSLVSPVRPPSGVIAILLPLTLLAGMLLGEFFSGVAESATWEREGLLVLIALPFVVGPLFRLTEYLAPLTPPTASTLTPLVLLGIFVLGLAIVFAGGWSLFGRAVALRAAGLLIVLLLGLALVRSTVSVAYSMSLIPQEFLTGSQTSPDVVRVVDDLQGVALDRFGAAQTQPVAVDASLTPTLLWYLRYFPNVDARNNAATSGVSQILAAAPTTPQVQPPQGYVGQRARFETNWTPSGMGPREWLRWFFYRDAGGAPPQVDWMIWFSKVSAPPQ
ncbi:MAG: TIGR03663 family protein [Anaerolineae bacterium]